jgi:uncharacterized protein involved in exopolysaccharide biosynthesis
VAANQPKYTGPDSDTFDVRATLDSLSEAARHHKTAIALCSLAMLAVAILYVRMFPPIYQTKGTMVAERDYDASRDGFYVSWNVFRKDDSRTEIELMTSGQVLNEVAHREHLTYDDVYHPFLSQVIYLWEKSAIGQAYRSVKYSILGPPDMGGLKKEDIEYGKLLADFRAGVGVEPIGESNVGQIIVKGPSRRVAHIANTLMDVYLESRTDRHVQEASQSNDLLAQQAEQAHKELQAVEARRLAFARDNHITFDFQKEGLEVAKLTELEANVIANRSKLAALKASYEIMKRQIAAEPSSRTVATTYELNSLRETVKLKRLELATSLMGLRERYREDSPEVTEVKNNMAKLDAMIAESSEKVEKTSSEGLNTFRQELVSKSNGIQSEMAATEATLAVLEDSASRLRERLTAVPGLQTELRSLDREMNVNQEKYQALLLKKAQASVSMATARSTVPTIRVVDRAMPPADPIWPKTKLLYPGALLLGALCGLLLAVGMEARQDRVRLRHLTGADQLIPLYAQVPAGDARPLRVVSGAANKG